MRGWGQDCFLWQENTKMRAFQGVVIKPQFRTRAKTGERGIHFTSPLSGDHSFVLVLFLFGFFLELHVFLAAERRSRMELLGQFGAGFHGIDFDYLWFQRT